MNVLLGQSVKLPTTLLGLKGSAHMLYEVLASQQMKAIGRDLIWAFPLDVASVRVVITNLTWIQKMMLE